MLKVVVTPDNAKVVSGAMSDITEDETKLEPKTLDLSGNVVVKIVDVRTDDRKVRYMAAKRISLLISQ